MTPIKPLTAWAAIHPGQRRVALAGVYDTARDAWADCIGHMFYRFGAGFDGKTTPGAARRAGYRVVKVRVTPV
jgi:hypothetical protein